MQSLKVSGYVLVQSRLGDVALNPMNTKGHFWRRIRFQSFWRLSRVVFLIPRKKMFDETIKDFDDSRFFLLFVFFSFIFSLVCVCVCFGCCSRCTICLVICFFSLGLFAPFFLFYVWLISQVCRFEGCERSFTQLGNLKVSEDISWLL